MKGYTAAQMIQDKAQSAENGHVLCKDCNAVLDHLELPSGEPCSAPPQCCASWQGRAISGEARLAMKRLTTR